VNNEPIWGELSVVVVGLGKMELCLEVKDQVVEGSNSVCCEMAEIKKSKVEMTGEDQVIEELKSVYFEIVEIEKKQVYYLMVLVQCQQN
jgi:hypothetical protein